MAIKSALGRSDVLRRIFKSFIAPFFNEITISATSEDNEVMMTKLEIFFGVKMRDIIIYKADRKFKMRGPKWHTKSTPNKFTIGLTSDYLVEKGAILWVRYDLRTPGIVEVESDLGVFRVDTSDWKVYREWVTEVA